MAICVPLSEKDAGALHQACERAVTWADSIELRLDYLEETPANLSTILENISCPVILTFRPSEQGGHRELSVAERKAFWANAPRGDKIAWDLEGDLVHEIAPDGRRVIVSHHDFSGVPTDLEQIYERLAATRARVVKIAVQANDITDCIPVFRLLDRARREDRKIIAIAMGSAGLATRILGLARGSVLTYGALDKESATAPGQVTAQDLRSLYRIDRVDNETMICGVVGLPVMHSLSPRFHNRCFAARKINGVYLPFEVKDISGFCRRMVHPRTRELDWNLRGLSVTAPHKQTVMDHLDWIDQQAREIGAVNTVVVESDRLLGYNTDAAGFIAPLQARLGSLADKQVAIIGAGGAARAAVWALRQERARITIFARNVATAAALNVECKALSSATFDGYDLVVNTTPLGSGEHIDESPATADQLAGACYVYDLIYNPTETKLLREARKVGCETLGGLEMLIAQANCQFELWTEKCG